MVLIEKGVEYSRCILCLAVERNSHQRCEGVKHGVSLSMRFKKFAFGMKIMRGRMKGWFLTCRPKFDMSVRPGITAAVLVALSFLGCSNLSANNNSKGIDYNETGKASYYALKYQDRTTASGERFDHWSNTAAHRHLPFGTRVKVSNVNNNKSVIVRVNDRGPFIKDRIIDLTRSAFAAIGDVDAGVIDVKIEVIE